MNAKQGFLLAETTLKIIIAVIAIGFLVYFLFMLYFNSSDSEKSKEARQLLFESREGSIKTIIDRVRAGQGNDGGTSEVKHVVDPRGWHVYSFLDTEPKPNSCVGKSCLCICDDVPFLGLFDSDAGLEECDEKGACLVVEDLKQEKVDISLDGDTELRMSYINSKVEVSLNGA